MPSPRPEPGTLFVVVSRYTPPSGGKVVTHVYGPRKDRSGINKYKKRIQADVGENPNIEYTICKVIDV